MAFTSIAMGSKYGAKMVFASKQTRANVAFALGLLQICNPCKSIFSSSDSGVCPCPGLTLFSLGRT